MAKRKRTRAPSRKTETIKLNLPREVWQTISDAGRMCDLQPDQVVGAILALRLATMPRDTRKFLAISSDQARATALALSLGAIPKGQPR